MKNPLVMTILFVLTSLNNQRHYYEYQQKSADYWSEVREGFLYAAMEVSGFPYSSVKCIVCDHTATAVCYDCGPRAFFCDDHIEIFHSTKINIFHIPQICKVY